MKKIFIPFMISALMAQPICASSTGETTYENELDNFQAGKTSSTSNSQNFGESPEVSLSSSGDRDPLRQHISTEEEASEKQIKASEGLIEIDKKSFENYENFLQNIDVYLENQYEAYEAYKAYEPSILFVITMATYGFYSYYRRNTPLRFIVGGICGCWVKFMFGSFMFDGYGRFILSIFEGGVIFLGLKLLNLLTKGLNRPTTPSGANAL